MIYLFEDRKDRMINHLNDDISEFPINTEKTINVSKNELTDFFQNLGNIDAIIIHKSYSFPSDVKLSDIKDIANDKSIPFVVFSGGVDSAVINKNEAVVNSGTLYSNLHPFLEFFKDTKKIKLPILVYGKNNYRKNEIKNFQNSVVPLIIKINSADLENSKRTIKKIVNESKTHLISDEFEDDKNILVRWLGEILKGSKELNKETIYNKVDKFISLQKSKLM